MNNSLQKVSNNKSLGLICLILFFWTTGCKYGTKDQDAKAIDQILSFTETGPISKAQNHAIDSVRNLIGKKDMARLIKFYSVKSFYQAGHSIDSLNSYSDSAIALFNKKSLIEENKNSYFAALLLKGDATYLDKKYSQAVLYYLEALSFQQKNLNHCAKKGLTMRIANVYYVQNRFSEAIKYFKENYDLELKCKPTSTLLKQFYDIQATLNTIGFCYERSNLLDSAGAFYQKDLDFIASSRKKGKIPTYALNDAAATALDNLGSIYLKQGILDKAEKCLKESIAIHYSGGDDAKIPPLIKLANLYIQKKNFNLANALLFRADSILLNKPNTEFQSRWHNAKSDLYHAQGNFKLAFDHQKKYLSLKDSLNKDLIKVSSINVEKEFANLEQKYELQSLEKKDAIKDIYLIFIASLLLMVIIIMVLLQHSTKQAKKNHQITKLHNLELQETLSKLEDANQNYARVMKVMAHDLRNPLGGISGIAQLLITDNQFPPDEKDSLEAIKSSADSALEMINEILNAVLTKDDEKNIVKVPVNIQTLLAQCVSLLKFKAAEKNQQLLLSEFDAITVNVNKEKIWRVFNNIIVNAIKFSHPNSTIMINVQDQDKHFLVSIIDNGIGIPAEFTSKIFDIFTETKRLGTSGEKPYGLGLSISKQIIEAHYGKIWYEPNPAGGTVFYIRLPK